jgi:MFS family permease
MRDRGLTPEAAVGVFSLLFVVTAVTRIIAGFLFDRFFAPLVGFVLFVLGGIGIAMLLPSWAPIYYLIAAALMGIATGAETDLLAYLTSRYFGMRAFGQLYGGLFLAFMLGSAIGPALLGFGYDAFGNYDATLYGLIASTAVASLLLLTLPRYPKLEGAPAH